MSKIYTSYFANWRNFPENSFAVGITRIPPNYWSRPNYEIFAPSRELLMSYRLGEIDENIFRRRYFNELKARELDPIKVAAELTKYDKDVILCCYEKPGDFCHRHLFADWLSGVVTVEELR